MGQREFQSVSNDQRERTGALESTQDSQVAVGHDCNSHWGSLAD